MRTDFRRRYFPERLDEYISEDNAVRVIDVFVDKLDLQELGFSRAEPSETGRLMPDFKTIADFRRDNKKAIRRVCTEFVGVCRELDLFSATLIAIDGSKFKAVNSRDKNFTRKSVERRLRKTQANIDRYVAKLDAVDRGEPEIRLGND